MDRKANLRFEYLNTHRRYFSNLGHLKKVYGVTPTAPGTQAIVDPDFEPHFFDDFIYTVVPQYTINRDYQLWLDDHHFIRSDYYIPELRVAVFFPGQLVEELDPYRPAPSKKGKELLLTDKNTEIIRQLGYRPVIIKPPTHKSMFKQFWDQVNTIYIKDNDVIKEFGVPKRNSFGDVGYDLHANISKTIPKGWNGSITTGVFLDIPYHLFASIVLRSSMARQGLLTHQSIIDPGFRGEFEVRIHNFSDKQIEIKRGDRIAQILFSYQLPTRLCVVSELSESERGTNGWGSSGK